MNFTAATTEVLVIVECLPKIVDGLVSRFCTSINKDTNFRLESYHVCDTIELRGHENTHLQHSTYGVKQPAMRIDLLLIFSFQDKDNLYRNKVIGIVTVGQNKLWGPIHRNLSCVLARASISSGDTAENLEQTSKM